MTKSSTHSVWEAMTASAYRAFREADEAKMRKSIDEGESEAERQKRLHQEESARRRGELAEGVD